MNDQPHRIRLSTAWEPPADQAACAWVRRFGRPAALDFGGEAWRVELVWSGQPARLVLNGTVLADRSLADVPHRFDVTVQIRARNELRLSLTTAMPLPATRRHGRVDLPAAVGELWLEIAAAAPRGTP